MRLWRGVGGLFCLLLVALACSHLKQVMRIIHRNPLTCTCEMVSRQEHPQEVLTLAIIGLAEHRRDRKWQYSGRCPAASR